MSADQDALATLESILQGSSAGPQLYPPNSRYYGVPATTMTLPNGTQAAYLTRRFVPQPERFLTLQWHVVTQSERLDQIAAAQFNDPLLYWRICDANRALRPSELTDTIGRVVRITLPENVPAPTGAL